MFNSILYDTRVNFPKWLPCLDQEDNLLRQSLAFATSFAGLFASDCLRWEAMVRVSLDEGSFAL